MSAIIVTGGAGFIGSHFVRSVLDETDARAVVVDKLTYAGSLLNLAEVEKHPRYAFHRADVADRDAVRKIFAEHRPSAVVHFAAETHVDRSIDDPGAVIRTNVVGTHELLEASRALFATLEPAERAAFRFVQISTDEVFGSLGGEGSFSETTPYAPNSPYSASKAAADHLVRAFHHTYGLPALITHCSNNYGPRQFPEKLIPLMILNALEGKPLPIYGDGANVRDWLHVDDHCRAVMAVLRRGVVGTSYTIGGFGECTNLEVVDRICEALEELVPTERNPALAAAGIRAYSDLKRFVPDRPGHDRRYAIDSTRIQTELAWRSTRTFAEGLKETVAWYLANRAWCEGVSGNYRRERLGLSAQGESPC